MTIYMVYLYVGRIFHLREVSSALVSICRSSTYRIGWMQPDRFPCEVGSPVIDIGRDLLAG